MYDYIKGIVTYIKNNSIVVDNNGIGYLIYVANPYSYEIGKEYKVFVYQQIKEDENSLFGFKTRLKGLILWKNWIVLIMK